MGQRSTLHKYILLMRRLLADVDILSSFLSVPPVVSAVRDQKMEVNVKLYEVNERDG